MLIQQKMPSRICFVREAFNCISWTHTVGFPSLVFFSCSSLLFQPMQSGLQTFRPFGTESGKFKLQMISFIESYLLDISHVPLQSDRGGECCKLSCWTSVSFVSTHPGTTTNASSSKVRAAIPSKSTNIQFTTVISSTSITTQNESNTSTIHKAIIKS